MFIYCKYEKLLRTQIYYCITIHISGIRRNLVFGIHDKRCMAYLALNRVRSVKLQFCEVQIENLFPKDRPLYKRIGI
jgi:hypothetical protein